MLLRAIGANIVPIISFLTALMLVSAYGIHAITTELLFVVSPNIKENIICNSYYIHSIEGSHFVASNAKNNWTTEIEDKICMLADGWQIYDVNGRPYFSKPKSTQWSNP